jgi:hypothetical protein
LAQPSAKGEEKTFFAKPAFPKTAVLRNEAKVCGLRWFEKTNPSLVRGFGRVENTNPKRSELRGKSAGTGLKMY